MADFPCSRQRRRRYAPAGHCCWVGHDRRNLRDGTGGPQDESLLWSAGDLKGTGLHVRELTTRPRPVGELTAWDTVALVTRDSARSAYSPP